MHHPVNRRLHTSKCYWARAMIRRAILTAALTLSTSAMAEDTAIWEGVYERSGKTIKTGEWIGIVGATGIVIGGIQSTVSIVSGHGPDIDENLFYDLGRIPLLFGVPITAGGALRQSKSVRTLNPDAPSPWLGTSAWVLWWGGGYHFDEGPFFSGLLLSGAYALALMQRGENRTYWDARTKAERDDIERSNFSLAMAPMSTTESQGLMLYGTF